MSYILMTRFCNPSPISFAEQTNKPGPIPPSRSIFEDPKKTPTRAGVACIISVV